MLSSDDDDNGDSDMFLDSLDHLSTSDESIDQLSSSYSYSYSSGCKLGYEVWVNEPSSVEERRHNFLHHLGFAEFASATTSEVLGSDRLVVGNAAVSRRHHMSSEDPHVEEASECCTREDELHHFMSNELHRFDKDEQHTSLAQQAVASSSPSALDPSLREDYPNLHHGTNNTSSWWKRFVSNNRLVPQESKPDLETHKAAPKIKVLQKNRSCLQLTAPYVGQHIHAHNGSVWMMKFSPDGRYLATGGEDGVVRVWHVRAVDAPSDYLTAEDYFCSKLNERKFSFRRKQPIHASVVFPDKVFHIEESPIQEFYGHSSDILDLAWSNSNCILSSSKDKTVRLWQLGCDESLNVFAHNDYVTCIHFNPVDDNYFISGSIDGKVRIWGLAEKRVVDWTDVRDVITAICYQPDGQGFIVGSITGTCRSYKASGDGLLLDAQIHIHGKKKTAGNKITGIKFSQEKSQRVMISSEDSKLRIFDGVDLTYKYKGLPKSGSQLSASFTSSERHIISLGADSRVYIWDHDTSRIPLSKQTKSVRSCEHFLCEGISVAIPWSGMETERGSLSNGSTFRTQEQLEAASRTRESDRFSLGSWFSMDGACRGSATWPEEKLSPWEVLTPEDQSHNTAAISEIWGLVIVAAGLDGTIRTFHNYGLPIRL
ncbi:hypothetical protein TIFTF001_003871 [Ficus carica]|uniref:Uncharacterized protein n=1 Tax=Ficus carica TaxID=3494 RepID=A0AA87Z9Q8_FICCA|nr:hypothetical protein TIFTF001_003871 [Ficus carica]